MSTDDLITQSGQALANSERLLNVLDEGESDTILAVAASRDTISDSWRLLGKSAHPAPVARRSSRSTR